MSDWSFHLLGWPWWLVLPIAAFAIWIVTRLLRLELSGQPRAVRNGVRSLRCLSLFGATLFLVEPSLTMSRDELILPKVAVLIDASGSMAATDEQMAVGRKLDEATALGFLDPALRPVGFRAVAEHFDQVQKDAVLIGRALHAQAEGWERGESSISAEACALADERIKTGNALAASAAGVDLVAERLSQQSALFARAAKQLRLSRDAAGDKEDPAKLALAIEGLIASGPAWSLAALAAQEASDQALVAGAEAGSPVAQALSRRQNLRRFDRAMGIAKRAIVPKLQEHADVDVLALQDRLAALNLDDVSAIDEAGATDFFGPLAQLARGWSQAHAGGVIVISDGRQTAGGDAIPVVQALRARGAAVETMAIGDPAPQRDAVIADLSGPADVFRGETIQLDATIRISGYPGSNWDVVLAQNGVEVDRHTVRGDGRWMQERFVVEDHGMRDQAGVRNFQARLEPTRERGEHGKTAGGITREAWTAAAGETIPPTAPATSDLVPVLAISDRAVGSAVRLRGYVIPPRTGAYTFTVSGSRGELWVSTNADPAKRERLAVLTGSEGQRTATQLMSAGTPYYLELIQTGAAAGAVEVGWRLSDNSIEKPIPASRFVPWRGGPSPDEAELSNYLPAYDAEASTANNVAECTVNINGDPLRVLAIDSTPRWDVRYLVHLLERDRRVHVSCTYRSIQHDAPLLPVGSRLDTLDAIVLGDIAPGELSGEDQGRLEEFVSRHGGFVIVIAGERGMPAAYSLGALADMLPVRVIAGAPSLKKPAHLILTDLGSSHPITVISDNQKDNERIWATLPPLTWMATSVTAKPSAAVLLETDTAERTPVVAAGRHGAGRVLWLASPETWRWRDPIGERVHQTFWQQAMRWGLAMRLRGRDARLQMATDRVLASPGDQVEVRARSRLGGASVVSRPLRARVEPVDDAGQVTLGGKREYDMEAIAGADLWHVQLLPLPIGHWRVTVFSTHPMLEGVEESRDIYVRERRGSESHDLSADPAFLARLSTAGGGETADAATVDRLVADFSATLHPRIHRLQRTVGLWQHYLGLLFVCAALTAEWIWRRQRGLP